MAITNTSATFTVLGINGRVKEAGVTRPIRVIPDGTFGVVLNGKVRKLNTSTFTVDMTSTETFDPALCRAAKLADIKGASPAPVVEAAPSMPTTVTMAPAAKAALVKGPRSEKQRQATLRLTEANLAKAKAEGNATRIAKAEKAVATAKANLVASPLPAKAEAVNLDDVVGKLKASGVNLSDLLIALAAKI